MRRRHSFIDPPSAGCTESVTLPGPVGRSHGVLTSFTAVPSGRYPTLADHHLYQPASKPSINGFPCGTETLRMASSGVLALVGHPQRISIWRVLSPSSRSCGSTAIIVSTLCHEGVFSFASFPLVREITTSYTPDGRVKSSFFAFVWAKFIKSLHIGAATLRPSPFHFVSRPSTFHAHTTVVICGVNPIVQRSRGRMRVFEMTLLLVPVFAADILPPARRRALRQNSDSGRDFSSESMRAVI